MNRLLAKRLVQMTAESKIAWRSRTGSRKRSHLIALFDGAGRDGHDNHEAIARSTHFLSSLAVTGRCRWREEDAERLLARSRFSAVSFEGQESFHCPTNVGRGMGPI